MSEVISTTFELAINVLQGFLFVYFSHKFLGSRFKPKQGQKRAPAELVSYISASLLFAVMLTIINYHYVVFNGVEVYCLAVFLVAYSFIFLQGKIILRIFIPIFSLCGYYAISSLSVFIMSSSTGESSYELMLFQSTFYRYLLVLLVNFAFFMFVMIVVRFRKHKFDLLKWTDWVAFIVIPVISMVILVLTCAVSLESTITSEHSMFLAIICLGVMIIAALIWGMLIKISKDSEIERKYSLLEQQYRYQHGNIVQTSRSLKEVSTLRHDMKNKLLLIAELIADGQTDKAVTICGACQREIAAAKMLVNSENYLLNAIINTKLAHAEENNILTDIIITTSNFSDVEDIDLCAILGNLLDNAIEAVLKEPKDSRVIKVNIKQSDLYRSITVKNSISKSILRENPTLQTTKRNKSIHGIGLLSVQKTAKKYGGSVRYTEDKGFFCCAVALEMPDERTDSVNKEDRLLAVKR